MYRSLTLSALALISLGPGNSVHAQTPERDTSAPLRELSLEQAIDAALDGNAELAVARARSQIAASHTRKAAAPLWPQLGVEAGYTRSNDPVFAFGTKLRQGTFGQADFQIEALNAPDDIADFSAAFGARWNLLDPKVWAARSAAANRATAASWSSQRTREATVLITRSLYYQALSASAQLEAAQAAVDAARSTVESFRNRQERGLLTEADRLQAEAELASTRATLSQAGAARLDALENLGRHLGWGPDSLPLPSDSLTAPRPPDQSAFDPSSRADLLALAAAEDAADAAKRQAALSFIPAVDAFGRFSTHSSDVLGFDEEDWTVGVSLRWPLFTGFGRFADVQRAEAQRNIARIQYEEAIRDARVELYQARRAVESARQQVEATEVARGAALEGRDLMRRRFNEGLATANDLLQAEARATAMRERAIVALANYHIVVARLEFVRSQSNQGN